MKTALSILLPALLAAITCSEESKKPDYAKERFAFADRDNFKPYALQALEKALVQQAMESWQNREEAEAFETFDQLLSIYPYSIEAHRRLADGCEIILESVEDAGQKKFFEDLEAKHRSAFRGILDSITADRDGQTADSAYEVITISEEYWVLAELGFNPTSRESDIENGFDIFTVKDSDEKERKVYFDISRLLNAKGAQEKEDPSSGESESASGEETEPETGSEEGSR